MLDCLLLVIDIGSNTIYTALKNVCSLQATTADYILPSVWTLPSVCGLKFAVQSLLLTLTVY